MRRVCYHLAKSLAAPWELLAIILGRERTKPTTKTSRHNISPIEVKSSTGFTTVSLEKCLKKYSSHLAQAYIIHTSDVERDGDYLYLPLYMVPCL